MPETRDLLAAWKAAEAKGEDWALATVVRVEGSSYRKPGARMLLARSGWRSGMVSGGCLEGDISKKIWWLTENGPSIQKYVSSFDNGAPAGDDPAFGLGCGGTVHVLLERASTARPVLQALRASVEEREASAILTVIASDHPEVRIGARSILSRSAGAQSTRGTAARAADENSLPPGIDPNALAKQALETGGNNILSVEFERRDVEIFAERIAPPFSLFLCGAGDDAQPLADLAHALGWRTTLVDGRSNLIRPERFPRADAFALLRSDAPLLGLDFADPAATQGPGRQPIDAGAVLLTHSYAQDRDLLRALLPLDLRYLGVLGPRSRTLRIVEEIAPSLRLSVEECMARLHAPVGLDLGADNPSGVALAIAAEIQATLHQRTAMPLREKASREARA